MAKKFDKTLDIFSRETLGLKNFFQPKTIAIIGATDRDNSVGKTLIINLKSFKGKIYAVNPKRDEVFGLKCYKSVKEIPEPVDLAVIAIPAKTVIHAISDCIEKEISSVIILSAGFKEIGEEGLLMEKKIMEIKPPEMRIIGPNCLGVMNPQIALNATFAADMALKGSIAFISQSGALCTAVLDWSLRERIGFSSFVSIGSMIDVDWGNLINYFANDPKTKSILIYMESIKDTRSFLSAARGASLTKPIILIKAGRTEESQKAAASHTGALAGSDEVFTAALKRVGVLRVDTINDLFNMAEIIAKQPKPTGSKLAIVTNAGGPGVIATDALVESEGKLAKLSQETYESLNQILPKEWSHNNPIDILGDAKPDLYAGTIEKVIKDENVDGVLVILTPQYMTEPTETALSIKKFSRENEKPFLASWMGAEIVKEGKRILLKENIPCFDFPDDACKTFSYMWGHSYSLKGIYETPALYEEKYSLQNYEIRKAQVQKFINHARKNHRKILTEYESKQILSIYDIPTVSIFVAENKKEAVLHAEKIGYPVVLKIHSETITHKSDVGGIALNLNNKEAVENAFDQIYQSVKEKAGEEHFLGVTVQPMVSLSGYELIVGSSVDEQFGPVIVFGSGGKLVEIYKDKSLALPPLNSVLAERLMERTKIYKALKGYRGEKSVDLEKLKKIIVLFSTLICEFPEIKEIDINPLFVAYKQIIALDARVILHEKAESYPKSAIRPYPVQYIKDIELEGEKIRLRPIRPEDEPLMRDFFEDLSQWENYQRYLKLNNYDKLTEKERMIWLCVPDYDREIVLVAENVKDGTIIGIGRLTKILATKNASFCLLVKEKYQNKGLGTKIIKRIIDIAEMEDLKQILAKIVPENKAIQKICEKLDFVVEKEDDEYFAYLNL